MFDKVIFHIDVNSAFLSWEAVYRMEVLGGKVDLRKKGCAEMLPRAEALFWQSP